MKLSIKIILYYLVIAIAVFSIGGVITYRLISDEISKETDYYLNHSLNIIEIRLERAVQQGYSLEKRFNTSQLFLRELTEMPSDTLKYYSDTLAMHPHLNQLEMMRKLQVKKEVAGKYFEIILIDVLIEDSDIYESVVKIISRLFALFCIVMIAGTILMSRNLLRPFNETLNFIRHFNVKDTKPKALPKTSTREFNQLNEFVQDMTNKARNEYQVLKKFSENASHEMQTPLAIATGKLDLLMDSENLSENQYHLIQGAQRSLKRLSNLGQGLALLTKIDNREFSRNDQVNFSEMLTETLDNFKELWEIKELHVETDIDPGVQLHLNAHLGSILLHNLIHNAIRHNLEGGRIYIQLKPHQLLVQNTGQRPTVPTSQLFSRFEKNGNSAESTGLGLAIVKEICDYHNMNIDYTYNTEHQILISW